MPEMMVTKVTIATKDTDKMVSFYKEIFEVNFTSFEAMGVTLYSGTLGNVTLMFCPNELLQIKAEKNNIQLTLKVPNINNVLDKIQLWGGKQIQDLITKDSYLATGITDPDGNSLELIQALS
jgi:predicted enzyme related to lactoylglutathione lyase